MEEKVWGFCWTGAAAPLQPCFKDYPVTKSKGFSCFPVTWWKNCLGRLIKPASWLQLPSQARCD